MVSPNPSSAATRIVFPRCFFPEPHRSLKLRVSCRRQLQPGLVSAPAGFEIAGQEMRQRHIPLCHRTLQPERIHAIGQRENLVEAMKVEQRDQLVVEGIHEARMDSRWLCRTMPAPPHSGRAAATRDRDCCRSRRFGDRAGAPACRRSRSPRTVSGSRDPCAPSQRRGMVREQAVAEIKSCNSLLVAARACGGEPRSYTGRRDDGD